MDTQAAGAQFATKSHTTTIDLQAEIIANQQKEIDRLNVLAVDNAAEIVRLKEIIEWYQGEAGKRMGEVARAEIAADDDEIALLKRQVHNLKRHIAEYCPAPAAPAEQARPTVKQLAAQLGDDKPWTRAEQDAFSVFLARFPNESSRGVMSLGDAWKAGRAFEAAAAPAAPLPAQPEQSAAQSPDEEAENDYALIQRLGGLLAEIAIVMKGPEPARKRWSYADLPEIVGVMKAELEIYKVRAAAAPAGAAPLPAQPEQSAQTDLSKRLRDYANSGWKYANNVVARTDLLAACDEIDRYYGGMMAWKQTAETKDRKLSEEITARCDERIASRLAGAAPLPELTGLSIGDDRKFCRLARAWDVAEHGEGDNAVKTWEALVAYIDSRSAASPSPAPAPTDAATAMLQRFASWMLLHRPEFFKDHACARCVPEGGDLVTAGFTCSLHEAYDVVGGILPGATSLTDDQVMDMAEPFHDVGGVKFDEVAFARHLLRMGGITSKESAETAKPQEPYTIRVMNALRALHIGDSSFEDWYSDYYGENGERGQRDKQRCRDAYAAGMEDPAIASVIVWGAMATEGESAETAAPGVSIGDDPEFDKLAEAWGDLIIKASSPTSFDMYDKKLAEARAALVAFLDRRAGAGTGDRQ